MHDCDQHDCPSPEENVGAEIREGFILLFSDSWLHEIYAPRPQQDRRLSIQSQAL